MIHIVEIDTQHRARVWFAFDEADFIRKVEADRRPDSEVTVYCQTSARQLLAEQGENADYPQQLAAQHGWDTPLYRADFLLGQGLYRSEPVSELRACLAAVASGHEFRIYADDESAADELDRDPLFKTKEGLDAYRKLRSQLVEMEIIAEDF